jgi:hypothetical protein
MDGDLLVCSHQVCLGRDGTSEKLVRVVIGMADGVVVGDSPGFECSSVAARTPPLVLFGYVV